MHKVKPVLIGLMSVVVMCGVVGGGLFPPTEAGGEERRTQLREQREARKLERHQRRRGFLLNRLSQLPACGPGTPGPRWVPDRPETTEFCDNTTGLWWEKTPDGTPRDWVDSGTHCANRDLDNGQTYRLPTVRELFSLVDYSQRNPALPVDQPFGNVQSADYWSATETVAANGSNSAWYVGFQGGHVRNNTKSTPNYVWCVRGLQGGA
ncbi:MAG: DUF1566 domain-containing protein [Nitrospirota bacterium]|nr:MAG: DUF1566 domain-containing protein [Nitrospirota bacterium]